MFENNGITTNQWESLDDNIWGHIVRSGVLRQKDLHSMMVVSKELATSLRNVASKAWPRINRENDCCGCLKTLSRFKNIQELSLPPLTHLGHGALSQLAKFKSLKRLAFSRTSLAAADGAVLYGFEKLVKLSFEDMKVDATFAQSILKLRNLKTLQLNNAVLDGLDVDFWEKLPVQLNHLEIRRCLPSGVGLNGLCRLTKLKTLTLGVNDFTRNDRDELLKSCVEDISLIVYGKHNPNEFGMLKTLKNLSSLEFEDVGECSMPRWMSKTNLKKISFNNGKVSCDESGGNKLPDTLTSLSMPMNCSRMASSILSKVIKLSSLSLNLPFVTKDLKLGSVDELVCLKIIGGELDGEFLENLKSLHKLEELHIGGCMSLTSKHLKHLETLKNLRSLTVSCSHISDDGCEQISHLNNLKNLSFYFCPMLNPGQIPNMYHLRSLKIGACFRLENNLANFLGKPFIAELDFLGLSLKINTNESDAAIEEFLTQNPSVVVDPNMNLI